MNRLWQYAGWYCAGKRSKRWRIEDGEPLKAVFLLDLHLAGTLEEN
jgi:hypothetical protein